MSKPQRKSGRDNQEHAARTKAANDRAAAAERQRKLAEQMKKKSK